MACRGTRPAAIRLRRSGSEGAGSASGHRHRGGGRNARAGAGRRDRDVRGDCSVRRQDALPADGRRPVGHARPSGLVPRQPGRHGRRGRPRRHRRPERPDRAGRAVRVHGRTARRGSAGIPRPAALSPAGSPAGGSSGASSRARACPRSHLRAAAGRSAAAAGRSAGRAAGARAADCRPAPSPAVAVATSGRRRARSVGPCGPARLTRRRRRRPACRHAYAARGRAEAPSVARGRAGSSDAATPLRRAARLDPVGASSRTACAGSRPRLRPAKSEAIAGARRRRSWRCRSAASLVGVATRRRGGDPAIAGRRTSRCDVATRAAGPGQARSYH